MKRKSSPEIIELSDDESTSSPRSSRHKRDSEELTSFSYGFCLTGIPGIVDEHSTLLIEDIFSEDPRFPLLQCVIFTYTLDLEFIFSAAPILQRTAITIIHGESPQKTDMMEVQRLKFPNLTLLRANLPIPYGTHHSKMIILRYTNGIRIGIGTSNFEPRDWLLKTQAWWIRDFPLKKSKNGQASEFEEGLSEYLAHYRFKNINLVNLIRPFDFSSAHVLLNFIF